MKATPITDAAVRMMSAVVLHGNGTATVGKTTFTYNLNKGVVDFTDIEGFLIVEPIFSICSNHSVVRKYGDYFQAITLTLGLHVYAVGESELLLEGAVPVEPLSSSFDNYRRPKVDIYGSEYVVGRRPRVDTYYQRRERVSEPARPLSKGELIVFAVAAGLTCVVGLAAALVSDRH